ncbi:SDR family oxidoreductase [uncultured Roseicyclus sp.]|uniref:SDR family NAD(P)-dependent oxidoreductase n=1 Tax=uncultured Roseicyclus sp. TaxID=543072 RepID=UPI0026288958|nr:SDR family oxidoreductase [uncultured Roseicyclus sp.]
MSQIAANPWPGLTGKTALVTGASSGLGAHFARLLAREGVMVTLAARRMDPMVALTAEITAAGGTAEALGLDVGDTDAVERVLSGRRFDILVNNAGIGDAGSALEQTTAQIDAMLDVNLKGAFHVARAVAAGMRDAGGGAIVNIASILAHRVTARTAAYAASKAGLLHLTRALALEWARHGIRVNALCPGYIETPINADFFATEAGATLIRRIPQRRLGRPEDLDGALLLLVSDAGRYITGADIVVDGGHLVTSL